MKQAETEPNQNGKVLSKVRFKSQRERQECKQCLGNVTDMIPGAKILKAILSGVYKWLYWLEPDVYVIRRWLWMGTSCL